MESQSFQSVTQERYYDLINTIQENMEKGNIDATKRQMGQLREHLDEILLGTLPNQSLLDQPLSVRLMPHSYSLDDVAEFSAKIRQANGNTNLTYRELYKMMLDQNVSIELRREIHEILVELKIIRKGEDKVQPYLRLIQNQQK